MSPGVNGLLGSCKDALPPLTPTLALAPERVSAISDFYKADIMAS